jgi:hypothetical protein
MPWRPVGPDPDEPPVGALLGELAEELNRHTQASLHCTEQARKLLDLGREDQERALQILRLKFGCLAAEAQRIYSDVFAALSLVRAVRQGGLIDDPNDFLDPPR